MWEHHTKTKRWADIAQHITIAPDGSIWTGRNWNHPPASAAGFNGNSTAGPFMLQIIGDFDTGKDPFDGEQKRSVLEVIAYLQKRFGLDSRTLRFHNEMSSKSCPGSSIDYDTVLHDLAEVRTQIDNRQPGARRDPNYPFPENTRAIWGIINDLQSAVPGNGGEANEEGCEHETEMEYEFERTTISPPERGLAARGDQLSPELIRSLQPHVINLNQGRFSATGQFKTEAEDVDAIFEQHLYDWARGRDGQKLPIVFYAHGGLTSEQNGLLIADEQVQWWLENGAYPIHFVWETGFLETLGQLINPRRQRAFDWAAPTDFALETLARGLGGVKIWMGMKVSAERASDRDGGARYAAKKLKEFCERPEFKDRVELHAVGHSAGSIFHAYFIPAALEEGAPAFQSLHFLAPAIRVDTFEQQLLNRIGPGKGVEHLSVFTMARAFELDDNIHSIYRKSILYLIYYALEPERKTPILGLEESIRANTKLKRLFDLDRRGGGSGEVIWSVTKERSGRSASTSRTHVGFNNDAPTMESAAQRILGHEVTQFTDTGERGLSLVESLMAQEPSLTPLLQSGFAFTQTGVATGGPPIQTPAILGAPQPAHASLPGGRKRALCIGIDRYPTAPLGGCANDARKWCNTFRRLGFEEPELLLDNEATRETIVARLSDLIHSSSAGDVVAIQFSGHGTQLRDLDGDETVGDSPGLDEALCPVDFHLGHFVIDDDLAALFDQIPQGVNVTVFSDCCHSGTITRLAIGTQPLRSVDSNVKARFITATPEMEQAHAAYRELLRDMHAVRGRGAYDQAREVLFCACRSREVALESNGHGHFTSHATEVLAAGVQGMTHADFQKRVLQAFGPNPTQNPELHCAPALRSGLLLAPSGATGDRNTFAAPQNDASTLRKELARALEDAAQALRG